MDLNPGFWHNRKVLVTGHTGFKGSWLVFWLSQLGAEIIGVSLPALKVKPSLYFEAKISKLVSNEYFVDIRNEVLIKEVFKKAKPDYVFHFAAQAYVNRSFVDPSESVSTNVLGTSNVLLAALSLDSVIGIIIATTDKVYQNNDNDKIFNEQDVLGGKDPYSASKAAAELVVASLASTCNPRNIPVTTVRAGNVIGGGDWAGGRLVPDLVNAINSNKTLIIRNPNATRPWQYVLDCIRGYLLLAQSHFDYKVNTVKSINFGPNVSISVKEFINTFEIAYGKKVNWKAVDSILNEAKYLKLNSSLALKLLGWHPLLESSEAISKTANWYSNFFDGYDALELISKELTEYVKAYK